MSYLVLARKWRPQTFKEVVGQTHVTRTLQNAIEKNMLAHAIIFSGARGVGKTSIARIVAKAINCEHGPGREPCNNCPICLEITKGSCVDVVEIDGASNRGIDEIRHLRENIMFQPVQARYKVYIIDEVHMLTREAFNALLKTLEEPPSHVFFIFATTEAAKIPDTIRSRCQHYEFRLLTPKEIQSHLARINEEEHLGLDNEAIELISRAALGSIRDSLSLLDQVVAFGARTKEDVSEALGLIPILTIKEIVTALLKGEPRAALLAIDKVHRFGGDLVKLTQELVVFLRDLLIYCEMGEEGQDLYQSPLYELDSFDREHLDRELISAILESLARSLEAISRSSTPRLLLETTLLRLCRIHEISRLDDLIKKVAALNGRNLVESESAHSIPAPTHPYPKEESGETKGLQTTPNRKKPTIPGPAPKEDTDTVVVREPEADKGSPGYKEDASTSQDRGDFRGYLERVLSGQNEPLLTYIQQVDDIRLNENDGISIVCSSNFLVGRLNDPKIKEELRRHAREFFGQEKSIEVVSSNGSGQNVDKGSGKRPPVQNSNQKMLSEKEALKRHPLVQEAIKVFGGKIESVELFRP